MNSSISVAAIRFCKHGLDFAAQRKVFILCFENISLITIAALCYLYFSKQYFQRVCSSEGIDQDSFLLIRKLVQINARFFFYEFTCFLINVPLETSPECFLFILCSFLLKFSNFLFQSCYFRAQAFCRLFCIIGLNNERFRHFRFTFPSQQFIFPFVQRGPADSMFRSNFFSRGFSNAKIDYSLFFLILL